jgi:RimJ/RimL family protein N-acetyltransferase
MQMIERGGSAIGHVRIDRDFPSSTEGTVSICVSPAIRGQNLSRPILAMGLRDAAEHGITRFLATVHKSNAASMRLFAGAGFLQISEDEKFVYLVLKDNGYSGTQE